MLGMKEVIFRLSSLRKCKALACSVGLARSACRGRSEPWTSRASSTVIVTGWTLGPLRLGSGLRSGLIRATFPHIFSFFAAYGHSNQEQSKNCLDDQGKSTHYP